MTQSLGQLEHPDALSRLQARLAHRYRFERELGRGRTSVLYFGQDLTHNRPITIRLVLPHAALSLDSERFLRELRAAARVEHSRILPLLDSGEVDLGDGARAIYYTVPYVSGESLRDRLDRERQLPIAESLRIAADVAGALAASHARGVVHGDVRPENILLSGGDSVAVLAGLGAGGLTSDSPIGARSSCRATLRRTREATSTRSVSCSTRCSRASCPAIRSCRSARGAARSRRTSSSSSRRRSRRTPPTGSRARRNSPTR